MGKFIFYAAFSECCNLCFELTTCYGSQINEIPVEKFLLPFNLYVVDKRLWSVEIVWSCYFTRAMRHRIACFCTSLYLYLLLQRCVVYLYLYINMLHVRYWNLKHWRVYLPLLFNSEGNASLSNFAVVYDVLININWPKKENCWFNYNVDRQFSPIVKKNDNNNN